jgi:hypothetical protein
MYLQMLVNFCDITCTGYNLPWLTSFMEEKFEETKRVIRSRKSKKDVDRQYNGQKMPKE